MRTLLATTLVTALLVALACSTGPDNSACSGRVVTHCMRGEPCHCNDVGNDFPPPVCVNAVWTCPSGYTLFEDCRGVPPGPNCDGGVADATGD